MAFIIVSCFTLGLSFYAESSSRLANSHSDEIRKIRVEKTEAIDHLINTLEKHHEFIEADSYDLSKEVNSLVSYWKLSEAENHNKRINFMLSIISYIEEKLEQSFNPYPNHISAEYNSLEDVLIEKMYHMYSSLRPYTCCFGRGRLYAKIDGKEVELYSKLDRHFSIKHSGKILDSKILKLEPHEVEQGYILLNILNYIDLSKAEVRVDLRP